MFVTRLSSGGSNYAMAVGGDDEREHGLGDAVEARVKGWDHQFRAATTGELALVAAW